MWKSCCLFLLTVGIIGCGTSPIPNLSFESLDQKGKVVKLSELRGKVVLIDFWATWCGPCIEAKPFIVELHKKYSSKGLFVVGLSNEKRSVVEQFEKKETQNYPVFLDTDNSVNLTLGVEAYPTVIIFGKGGELIFKGHPGEKEEILQILDENLK